MSEKEDFLEVKYPTSTHLSYSLGSFFDDFVATVLATWVFKFYETEIFLPITFITIAIVIYGVWNAFNDPIAGHISGYSFKFMKRFGKRFSWFIIAAIPCSLVFTLIFIPPANDISGFFWLLITLCLFDTLFSFTIINWQGIFPDKFRSQKERTKVGGIQILCSLFGLAIGMLLPMFIITTGAPGTNVGSYISASSIVSIICLVIVLFMTFGMCEDKEMIDRTFKLENKREKREPYLRKLVLGLKQKNFIAYLFAYLAQVLVMALMLASLPYYLQYVLKVDSDIMETILLLAFLLGSVFSAPFWIKFARKYGNRIGYMCGTGGTAVFLIITMFMPNIIGVMICMVLVGISMGATWSLIYACFSDVIDEIVLKTGKRDEGVYYGFRTFFGRLSIVIQAITFGIIHPLTNFDPTSVTQSIEAQWGIIIGMFAIPAIFYFIGFIFMWKVHDITPEKATENKKKLKELGL